MHARITEVLEYLDANRAALEQAVDEVPAAHRERRPAPDRWSVAEIVQHLSIVEGRLVGILDEKLSAAKAAGLGAEQETTSVIDPADITLLTDRTQRVEAPDATRPATGISTQAALAALGESRKQLRALVLSGDGLALGEVMHPHRLFGPFTFYRWMVFLGGHEARHTLQIRENAVYFSSASRF